MPPARARPAADRMFCRITQNWRGRPLLSHAVVVNLIGRTRTRTGLKVRAELDTNSYAKGIKVTDPEMESLQLTKDKCRGEWNSKILPPEKSYHYLETLF